MTVPFINKDLTIYTYADFADDELYDPNTVPVDLTTYTAKMIVRVNKTDVTTPPLTLTSPIVGSTGIGLNFSGTLGAVHIAISNSLTAGLGNTMPGLSGFYDLMLTSGGVIVPFMAGAIILDIGVTH